MFHKLRQMWQNFFDRLKVLKQAFKGKPIDEEITNYTDISVVNWLAIAVSKLANLTCTEATYTVESDSSLSEPLKNLCASLEGKRFSITEGMLAGGDYYAFPSTDSKGNLYHSYLDASRVRITEMDGDNVISAYAVIDYYQPSTSKIFFLQRHHHLLPNGDLQISYQVVNEDGQPTSVDYWSELTENDILIKGANHIGFGRYKSPVSSRGLSPIYGVPLNFGCSEIEAQLKETLEQITDEFRNGKSTIFTDPRNLLKKDETQEYKIANNIIPVKKMAGETGNQIDIFNPTLRFSEHYSKLQNQLSIYEQQMGCSKGIFTENEAMATGTATAVRRANADTIALINSIHNSLDIGNEMTLQADGIFLGIRPDLWEYSSDYYDAFADAAEQWQLLKDGYDAGAISIDHLTKWIYPDMTQEQIDEELEKVKTSQSQNSATAIQQALMM